MAHLAIFQQTAFYTPSPHLRTFNKDIQVVFFGIPLYVLRLID